MDTEREEEMCMCIDIAHMGVVWMRGFEYREKEERNVGVGMTTSRVHARRTARTLVWGDG